MNKASIIALSANIVFAGWPQLSDPLHQAAVTKRYADMFARADTNILASNSISMSVSANTSFWAIREKQLTAEDVAVFDSALMKSVRVIHEGEFA